ncbi:Hypothetical predicted protein [Pelobates cultripes]|uniref:Coiled-coil domain containing 191 n=3 Tax=Pelobates cultripes TaxID=61616 RepID=A0AAD1QWJ9_PELCU|nr:Hypothetical predicted protein [Pelobates cultripes]
MERVPRPVFDYDNVEHWIKRVEQASEFAVSEVFSAKKTVQRGQKAMRPALDLESVDQLHDHDDAYAEAQDLLSEWMGTKLKMELVSEDEEDPDIVRAQINPPQQPQPDFVKYNRFDDLYEYLEQEAESTKAQDFLQDLLQKQVVDSGILENLMRDHNCKKQRDPRLTIELRHQQVKENRDKRQKEQEKKRQEKALKKAAMAQAQVMVQEESKQKAMKIKKEEEEIQKMVVKLRKDMTERRKAMDEVRKIEWKKKEIESSRKLQERMETQRDTQKEEDERRKLEKQSRIKDLLGQVYAENRRCLQKSFSGWYKLVLERRLKMGKSRALADWRCQLRVFRAWRDYVWAKKLEVETQKMEMDLRDQNRKQQLAVESYRKRILRHCFVDWQLWCRAEKDKRELEAQKEETKRKMAALLEAASSLVTPKDTSADQRDVGRPSSRELKVEENNGSENGQKTPGDVNKNIPGQSPNVPKHAWQITRKHAELSSEELDQLRLQSSKNTPRLQRGPNKKAPNYGEVFENRHTFQQQLIEEQRQQLQEQKDMILGLMENQRLIISRQEAARATTFTTELSSKGTTRKGNYQGTEGPPALNHPGPPSVSSRSFTVPTISPHPVVKAMEERAAQRLERKRELEETRRRREEEKLAQLKAAEEERLQREAAEREAQLERRKEEKRLQRQREQEKQMRLEKDQEMQEKARAHYDKTLLRHRGLEPWKKLMAKSRLAMEHAEGHHSSVIMRGCLVGWHQATKDILSSKVSRADELWTSILLRRSFRQWIKYKDYLSILEERAERHHVTMLRRKVFLAWLDLAQEEKMALWEKQRIAAEHNQRRILLTAFRTWRKFPKLMRELKLKEERRELLRKKVAEILPDFRA